MINSQIVVETKKEKQKIKIVLRNKKRIIFSPGMKL